MYKFYRVSFVSFFSAGQGLGLGPREGYSLTDEDRTLLNRNTYIKIERAK